MAILASSAWGNALADAIRGDSTSSTGDYIRMDFTQPSPVQMYSSPSSERTVEKEEFRRMADRIKNLERREKMKETLMFTPKKIQAKWSPRNTRPKWEDEFTQLYNHDFHKLLANFDALLEN